MTKKRNGNIMNMNQFEKRERFLQNWLHFRNYKEFEVGKMKIYELEDYK